MFSSLHQVHISNYGNYEPLVQSAQGSKHGVTLLNPLKPGHSTVTVAILKQMSTIFGNGSSQVLKLFTSSSC